MYGFDLPSKAGIVTARQFDALGNLNSSQSITLPGHGVLSGCQPRTEFSDVLLPDRDGDNIMRTDHVFSSTTQKITNVTLDYNAITRRWSRRERSSQLPVMRSSMKKRLEYLGFFCHTIHSWDVFSITYKERSSQGGQGQTTSCFEDKVAFYSWQKDQNLTLAASEIDSINSKIQDEADGRFLSKRPWRCFGDKRFLVKYVEKAIEIYCFDKDFHQAQEYELYREERNRRTLKRSNNRRRKPAKIAES